MTRKSQRYRETTLPFRYRDDGLEFELESYSLDGKKPRELDLKPAQRHVDLSPTTLSETEGVSEEPFWERVTLFGRISVSEDLVESVFPPEERDAPPAKLYVAVRCHDTILRERQNEWPAPLKTNTHDVNLTLDWADVRSTVELRPYLVRTEEREGGEQFAKERGVRVASGPRYEVLVDRLDTDEPAAIDGQEVSFSEADHLPASSKLYHLDFRNEARPKLWVNADHPRITDVLQSDGSVGTEPRLRDVILDQISYGVWTQLVLRTAAGIDEQGNVPHDWQQNVLETFARELYDVDDVTDAAHRLRRDATEPAGLAQLASRLDHELQEYIEPRTQLINLMEEGLQF